MSGVREEHSYKNDRKLALQISQELLEVLQELARTEDRSHSAVVRQAIRLYAERKASQ